MEAQGNNAIVIPAQEMELQQSNVAFNPDFGYFLMVPQPVLDEHLFCYLSKEDMAVLRLVCKDFLIRVSGGLRWIQMLAPEDHVPFFARCSRFGYQPGTVTLRPHLSFEMPKINWKLFENVKRLFLHFRARKDIGSDWLRDIPPNVLTRLSLSEGCFPLSDFMPHLPRSVKEMCCVIGTNNLESFVAQLPPTLENLWLPSARWTTQACLNLLPQKLITLRLERCNNTFTPEMMRSFPTSLKNLSLKGNIFDQNAIFYIPTTLTTLALDGVNQVTEEFFKHTKFPYLKELHVNECDNFDFNCLKSLPTTLVALEMVGCTLEIFGTLDLLSFKLERIRIGRFKSLSLLELACLHERQALIEKLLQSGYKLGLNTAVYFYLYSVAGCLHRTGVCTETPSLNERMKTLTTLIAAGPNLNVHIFVKNYFIDAQIVVDTCLGLCARYGFVDEARFLIGSTLILDDAFIWANPVLTHDVCLMPFHEACACGSIEIVQAYFHWWVVTDLVNYKHPHTGQAALHFACGSKEDCSLIVAYLLRHGADPNLVDNDGMTPLLCAAKHGFTGNLEAILQVCETEPNVTKITTWNAVDKTHQQNVYHLLAFRNENVLKGEKLARICGFLIRNGVDINAYDKYGQNPLHIAVAKNVEFMNALISYGANHTIGHLYTGFTPLHFAIKYHNLESAKQLLQLNHVDPNLVDKFGQSALHIAVTSFSKDILELLLNSSKKLLDVEIVSIFGRTPLQEAIANRVEEPIKLLLHAGANPNGVPREHPKFVAGLEPIFLALQIQSPIVIRYLLHYGVNLDVCNSIGQKPLDIAHATNKSEIIGLVSGAIRVEQLTPVTMRERMEKRAQTAVVPEVDLEKKAPRASKPKVKTAFRLDLTDDFPELPSPKQKKKQTQPKEKGSKQKKRAASSPKEGRKAKKAKKD